MDRFYDFVGVNFWDALFVLLNTLIIFFVVGSASRAIASHIANNQQEQHASESKLNEEQRLAIEAQAAGDR